MLGFGLDRMREDKKRQPLFGRRALPGRWLSAVLGASGEAVCRVLPSSLGEGRPLMPLLMQLALFTQNLRTAGLEGPFKISWANPSLHRWGK